MIPLPRRALPRGAAIILTVGLLAAACGGDRGGAETAGSGGPPDQVTYLTAFGLFGREGYVHVADAKGFFAEQNIEVTIQPGDPQTGPNEGVLSAGKAEFASTDSSAAMQRYQAGANGFRIISAVQQTPLTAIITTEGTGIVTAQDLEGKTLGCAEKGIGALLLPTYMNLLNADASTVKIEPLSGADLPGALASGRVDGVCLFAVGQPAIEAVTGEPAVVLSYDEVLPDLYGAVVIASADLVENDPDLVRRFNIAIMQGVEYAVAHPEEAGQILAGYVPETNPAVAAGELSIMAPFVRAGLTDRQPTGTMVASKWGRALTFIEGAGLVSAAGPPPAVDLADEVVAWDLVPGADEQDLERE